MARISRMLTAVSLGVAAVAAVAVTVVAQEYAPVHRTPTNLADSTTSGRVMVKFKSRSTTLSATTSAARSGPQAATALASRTGLALADGRAIDTETQVITAQGVDSATLAATLAQDADVEWAEVDHRRFIQTAPNDPLYPSGQASPEPAVGQWYLRAPDATAKAAIGAEAAWAVTTNASSATAASSSAIVIADIDTGITSHPDLASKLFANGALVYGYDFVGYSNGSNALGVANDGNLADPDPSDPGDWITATENSTKGGPYFGCVDSGKGAAVGENSSWHGTQTAGILGAATNNGVGVAGVGYGSMVVPVRALGKCGGFDSDIIAAIRWAGGISTDSSLPVNTHPARVINMSLGGSTSCGSAYQSALTALRNAKVVVVAAAGNDTGLAVEAPANCVPAATDNDQTPIVVAVAGLRQSGTKVGYSDIGPQVTVAAPAGNCVNTDSSLPCLYPIVTTSNTGTTAPVASKYTGSGSDASLGTSFATPMVSGTVALMLAANPTLTNAQVISMLKSTSTTFPTTSDTGANVPACTVPTSNSPIQDECICTTATCGAGMLDTGAAVVAAAAAAVVPPSSGISAGTSTVAVGSSITLSASTQTNALTYQWLVTSGGGFVSLANSTSASVTVTGVAAGSATVQLTVTDTGTGASSSSTSNVTVTAATTGGGSTGGGGGGGGASSPAWLAALMLAGALLAPRRRRDR